MRFADARAAAALAALILLGVSTAAGAAPRGSSRPPKSIGGVTAVPVKMVRITGGKNPVYDSRYTNRTLKKQFRPLYAGNTITTDKHGEADFTLQLKGKTLYCSIRGVGPLDGVLTVSPPNGDAMYLQNGTLLCATSSSGTPEQISVQDVTVKVVDPVFTISATKQRVVLKLRRGAAKVTGSDPQKAVVAGLGTRQANQQKLQTVVVPAGGNPTQPSTTTLPLDPAIARLEQKAPPAPPPPATPPTTKLGTGPPAVNGANPFPFTFTTDPYVSNALFSCSLNGGPFYACTSGQPSQPLPPGENTLTVQATSPAGTVGPPVSTTWFQERSPSAPIAFQSNRSGKFQLHQVDPDGGNLDRLTSATGFDPAWSPDGTEIAFESDRNKGFGSEIYVQTVGTDQAVRLTRNQANDRTPKWSPDGSQIVFASNRTGEYQIYVTAADGSSRNKPTQLTFAGENSDPSWSTGNRIAFESTRSGKPEIYVMNADGTRQKRLTTTSEGSNLNPSWSPSGKSIVFDSGRNGNEEIYLMNADGSNQRRLTFNDARDSNPVFSPDGKRFAFSSDRSGTADIWIATLDGKNVVQVTADEKDNLAPSW